MPNNTQDLAQWCEEQLSLPVDIEPLSGDASFRRYSRIIAKGQPTSRWIAVYAPPETEKNHEFVAISRALLAAGVTAPEVLAVDYEKGYILQQDLGDQLLLPLLDEQQVDHWYNKALALIIRMQGLSHASLPDLPDYDRALLLAEMELFPQWFIREMLQLELSSNEQQMLDSVFALLANSALEQPQVFVHRDYHARNLMVGGNDLKTGTAANTDGLADSELLVIDFQDAVWGAITYDAVSLLRDCYLRWPDEKIAVWLEQFRQQLLASGVDHPAVTDSAAFRQAFDLMGLQRHIKVLGIFARLYLRDGKQGYLGDLPRVVCYTLDVATKYPQLSQFVEFFKSRLMPLVEQQQWWREQRKEWWTLA